MSQTARGTLVKEDPNTTPIESAHSPPIDGRMSGARMPDSVATVSYGTQVVGRLGAGPRLF